MEGAPLVRQHSRSSSQFASTFGPLSPLTATAPQLPSPDKEPRPERASAQERRRFGSDASLTTRPRSGTTTPSLPPTDPWTPAQSSFPSTSNSLAQFIQTKRRQASAPYFASARSQSLFSPGAGFSLGPGEAAPPADDDSQSRPVSRNRSRASSRRATATGGLTALRTHGLESFADIAQHDGGLVPTPTIEEWRQLGSDLNALAELRIKEEAGREEEQQQKPKPKWKRWPSLQDSWDDDDDDDSSGDQAEDFRLSLSLSTLGRNKRQLPHTPPSAEDEDDSPRPSYKSSFSYSSSGFGSTGGFVSHSNTRSLGQPSPDPDTMAFEKQPASDADKSPAERMLTHASRPSLSRGSLSTATGTLSTPSPPRSSSTESLSVLQHAHAAEEPGRAPKPHLPPDIYRVIAETATPDDFPSSAPTPFDGDPFASSAPAGTSVPPTPYYRAEDNVKLETTKTGGGAVDLDWTKPLGPVDPRTYSAVTGLRDIRSFVCEDEEAGKGAYGSVRRARERGPDGKPIGVSRASLGEHTRFQH